MIVIFFFFFFFDQIIDNPIIREAFKQVCADKLLSDMYCDMEEYISGRIDKKDMLNSLLAIESPYSELYKKPYPTAEDGVSIWRDFQKNYLEDLEGFHFDERNEEFQNEYQLGLLEAKAIVNWMYRAYPNMEMRKDETKTILHQISKTFDIAELDFADCIIYVKSKVEINIINSFGSFCKAMQDIGSAKKTSYYRGHSDINYLLLPSIMRRREWLDHECDIYNELIIECPEEFSHCFAHLDYLVHMQHYGLPTRMLDVTRNPLVALYFACESNPTKKGEVIVFDVEREIVKYPGSDTVTILASIPLFKKKLKVDLAAWAADPKISQKDFNEKAVRLLHEVKLEKPAFRDEIRKKDILDCFFVLSEKRNNRIIKQDGAFIICGLFNKRYNPIHKYRYTYKGKIQIYTIPANKKKGILNMLNKFSINKASLFPEISDVTEFIKGKY